MRARKNSDKFMTATDNSAQPEEFINKAEVARRLKKQVRTIDNWMRLGLLPYYKIGRSVNFKWSEVETHLGQNCRICRITRGFRKTETQPA
jgi:excisionase family DNA binding protein